MMTVSRLFESARTIPVAPSRKAARYIQRRNCFSSMLCPPLSWTQCSYATEGKMTIKISDQTGWLLAQDCQYRQHKEQHISGEAMPGGQQKRGARILAPLFHL